MRIVLTLGAAAVGLALALSACGGTDAAGGADDGRVDVVASFYPLAYAAEQIGAGRASVHDLTPPGAEPHDVEVSVRDVARVRSADLVLFLGGGFQPAVEEAAAEADGRTLDVLSPVGGGGDDPHVWLDPALYARIAREIAVALGDEGAAADLVRRLQALDRELEQGLERCERREIVTSHAAFGHLAEAYRLEQIAVAGLAPEAEPAPRDVERVARLVADRGVTTVFVEPLAPAAAAETIARETGAEVAVLDPIEGLTPEARDRGEDYFSLMRGNLAALREALGCR